MICTPIHRLEPCIGHINPRSFFPSFSLSSQVCPAPLPQGQIFFLSKTGLFLLLRHSHAPELFFLRICPLQCLRLPSSGAAQALYLVTQLFFWQLIQKHHFPEHSAQRRIERAASKHLLSPPDYRA